MNSFILTGKSIRKAPRVKGDTYSSRKRTAMEEMRISLAVSKRVWNIILLLDFK
jgi:hypothetical protein